MPITEFDLKNRFPKVSNLLSNSETELFKKLSLKELEIIYQEYKGDENSIEKFYEKTIWHESIGMKLLATRILLKLNPNWMLKKLNLAMHKINPGISYYLHPIFYFRITSPDINHRHTIKKALFDSQPHYDRSFGLKAFSFWIALVDINKETGGLCFFEKNELVENLFPIESKINKYDSTKYIQNYNFVDKNISKFIQYPFLKKGQAYLFSWYDLHGATKPLSAQRISFDIRVHDMNIDDDSKPFVVKAFQKSLNLSLLLSLYEYGDRKFFNQTIALEEIFNFFQNISPRNNYLTNISERLKWREEYSWVEDKKFLALFENKKILDCFNDFNFKNSKNFNLRL